MTMNANPFPLTGSSYKTNWPLLIFLFLMPLRNIQLQYIPNLGGGINFINIFFLLSLGHALVYGRKLDVKPKINGMIKWYVLTSILALILGYMFLGDKNYGLWKDMKDMLIPAFLVFVVQKSAADDVQWRRIFIAMLLPLPYCFKVVWSQYKAVASWHYSDDLRISGTFMDLGANEMGAFTLMMALVTFACLLTTWAHKKWRFLFGFMFVISVMCLVYSYSRGGYLAFLLGFIIIFKGFKNRKKLIAPLLFTVLLFIFNMPESVQERFSSINASEGERDESAQSRFVFWAIAFDKFLERPIAGYGYHTVQDKRINPHEMDTHNYYVKMLVERGVIGFITFIALLLSFRSLIKRNLEYDEPDSLKYGLVLGMSGALAGMMLGNMFGDRFSHYPIITYFWVMISLISVLDIQREKKTAKQDWTASVVT